MVIEFKILNGQGQLNDLLKYTMDDIQIKFKKGEGYQDFEILGKVVTEKVSYDHTSLILLKWVPNYFTKIFTFQINIHYAV